MKKNFWTLVAANATLQLYLYFNQAFDVYDGFIISWISVISLLTLPNLFFEKYFAILFLATIVSMLMLFLAPGLIIPIPLLAISVVTIVYATVISALYRLYEFVLRPF